MHYGAVDRERLALFKLRRLLEAFAWALGVSAPEHLLLERLAWLESNLWQHSEKTDYQNEGAKGAA
jgi:hypothetical protein